MSSRPGSSLNLERVRAILTDVDGVLTDGRILLGPGGVEMKFFQAKEGHRMKMASRAGLRIVFVTGRTSAAAAQRAGEVGATVYQSVKDKLAMLETIVAETGVPAEDMIFVGDDLIDLPIMRTVGFSACPNDAAPEVLERAGLIIDLPGGGGVIGWLIEEILKQRGTWPEMLAKYTDDHD